MSEQTVWMVGRIFPNEPTRSWEFFGVFTTERFANEACLEQTDFYAPYVLNVRAPEETVPMSEFVFPRYEEAFVA